MADKLYDLMDWAKIEGIVYSDECHPGEILGPHVVKGGVLVQAFFPDAEDVNIKVEGKKKIYPMTLEDEEGFFAALLPGKAIPDYVFQVDGAEKKDPYRYGSLITEEQQTAFGAGTCYKAYEMLGAHPCVVDGVPGVHFAVWAPDAVRVSVVGEFNDWDGRVCPMNLLDACGIYELFIPEIENGALYKYELRLRNGRICLKADPYGNQTEEITGDASKIINMKTYHWHDKTYIEKRRKIVDAADMPIAIYEVNLGEWKKKEDGSAYSYREIAPVLAAHVIDMGYTHVEFMPLMEYAEDESLGYQTSNFYAPTSRYGTPNELKELIDTLHQAGIGVIMDWTPSQFSGEDSGLAEFDGTCLYEHLNPKQGIHPLWGTRIFNYGRPQVKNFLIANALFWIRVYHLDGLRMDGVSTILRLDYARKEGEWIPNIYGSNENLEGIEFLKHLNSIMKKKYPDVLMILEEDTDWSQTTGSVEDDCLGFDYKWNLHWTEDMVRYLSYDPLFRGAHHNDLSVNMLYQYMDRYMVSLSRDVIAFDPERFRSRIPGDDKKKDATLRAAYGFMTAYPGKKLFSAGEDAQQEYFRALLDLYKTEPALSAIDYDPDGFEWINFMDATHNVISFLRKTEKVTDMLLVVCNFSALQYTNYQIGVPYSGKYKEIFNSDAEIFGGDGFVNPRVKMTKKAECDERADSITIKVPALGCAVFKYSRAVARAVDNKTAKSTKKGTAKSANLKKKLEDIIEKEEK